MSCLHLSRLPFTMFIGMGIASLSPSAQAQVDWGVNTSHFALDPEVVQTITGFAAGGTFAGSGTLTDTVDGFKYSSATISYTTVAADINKNLTMKWQIQRSGQIQGAGVTAPTLVTSHLDGTLGISSTSIGLAPTFTEDTYFIANAGNRETATVSTTGFQPNGSGGPNSFDQTASALLNVTTHTNVLYQDFQLSFTPTAAGENITVNLPSSSESTATASTPEPSALALFGIGSALLFLRRRRRPAC